MSRKSLKRNSNRNRKLSKKIKHKILGREPLYQHYTLFKQLNKNITITFNSKKIRKMKIDAITVPHAGFQYSGILGLFSIYDILESNQNCKEITILWFKHNPNLNVPEHSLENVKKLLKMINKSIIIKTKLITKQSDFLKLNLKTPFLVSTDFAHYNNGLPTNHLLDAWKNDTPYLKMLEKSVEKFLIKTRTPCGIQPLGIMSKWNTIYNNDILLNAYANSKFKEKWWLIDDDTFDGVTYAALLSVQKSSLNWFSRLNSKLLAYAHLGFVDDCLQNNISNNGLFWSPLNNISGSCFVTINDKKDATYSCFGSWNKPNLLENMIEATENVKTSRWHSHEPVNKTVLINKLENKYSIDITLIEPQEQWARIEKINESLLENRGYVYCHKLSKKVGMTFLPSVWKEIPNKSSFFENLETKHRGVYPSNFEDWDLYCYESLTWKFYKFL